MYFLRCVAPVLTTIVVFLITFGAINGELDNNANPAAAAQQQQPPEFDADEPVAQPGPANLAADDTGAGDKSKPNEAQEQIGNYHVDLPLDNNKRSADDNNDEVAAEQLNKKGNAGFTHAFVATLSVIVVSELGDKTFFIAAIMAMRHSRVIVFAGAMSALALMHVMSALFGSLAAIIPKKVTFYLSSALFAVFGVKMLKEGWSMSPDEGQEEYEETQAELKKYEDDQLQARSAVVQDPETGIVRTRGRQYQWLVCLSPLFIQAATLNFLAEWGDRSQIAAIILAARENIIGVILGGILGHFLCTGLAVLGGRFIAQRISIRTVTIIGGVVFLLFAVSAFFVNPDAA